MALPNLPLNVPSDVRQVDGTDGFYDNKRDVDRRPSQTHRGMKRDDGRIPRPSEVGSSSKPVGMRYLEDS